MNSVLKGFQNRIVQAPGWMQVPDWSKFGWALEVQGSALSAKVQRNVLEASGVRLRIALRIRSGPRRVQLPNTPQKVLTYMRTILNPSNLLGLNTPLYSP